MSGPSRRDASSDESNFVGATGGDPRVGRVDESNTQPPRRSLVSGPVGATRRTTAERVESTVEFCRSDKSTGRYDSKTRVGPRRVASGRAWTWLMSPPGEGWLGAPAGAPGTPGCPSVSEKREASFVVPRVQYGVGLRPSFTLEVGTSHTLEAYSIYHGNSPGS